MNIQYLICHNDLILNFKNELMEEELNFNVK